jgi:hypothetical protein
MMAALAPRLWDAEVVDALEIGGGDVHEEVLPYLAY